MAWFHSCEVSEQAELICNDRKWSGNCLKWGESWRLAPKGEKGTFWREAVCCAQSRPTLQPHGLQPTRLLCPWDLPGKKPGVGHHSLFLGIFLSQGLNLRFLRLLRWQADSVSLSHLGSPSEMMEMFCLNRGDSSERVYRCQNLSSKTKKKTTCQAPRLKHLHFMTSASNRMKSVKFKKKRGFPGVQRLRIHLPVQRTWVWSPIWEDPTCRGAAKRLHCNYWARAPKQ